MALPPLRIHKLSTKTCPYVGCTLKVGTKYLLASVRSLSAPRRWERNRGIVEHTMTMSSRRRANTPTKASLLAAASIALLLAIVAAPTACAFHSPLLPAGSSSSATAAAAAPFRRRSSERQQRHGGGAMALPLSRIHKLSTKMRPYVGCTLKVGTKHLLASVRSLSAPRRWERNCGIVEHTMTMSSRRCADTPTKASLLATASIALLLAIVAAPAACAFHSPLLPAGSSSSATAAAAAPLRRWSSKH
jgi:hypothetical protein